jgi:hypothetical protein
LLDLIQIPGVFEDTTLIWFVVRLPFLEFVFIVSSRLMFLQLNPGQPVGTILADSLPGNGYSLCLNNEARILISVMEPVPGLMYIHSWASLCLGVI